MREHCPEDGAFIGDAGCTHPNHQHSKLVECIISDGKAKKLRTISPADCAAALTEGFYVDGPNGKRIGFGKKLLEHFNNGHDLSDPKMAAKIADRKRKLLYAVNTVMFPAKSENDHKRIAGRTAYFKKFDKFGLQAVTSKEGDKIEYVFTHIVKYSQGKNKGNGAAHSFGIASATASRGDSQGNQVTAFPPRSQKATETVPKCDTENYTISAPNAQGGAE